MTDEEKLREVIAYWLEKARESLAAAHAEMTAQLILQSETRNPLPLITGHGSRVTGHEFSQHSLFGHEPTVTKKRETEEAEKLVWCPRISRISPGFPDFLRRKGFVSQASGKVRAGQP